MRSCTRRRQHLALEAPEVCVHHVERHLDRVEAEAVRLRGVEHPVVHRRILVAGEADEADLARLARGGERLDRAALGEDAVGILEPDRLVDLHQVDVVGAESAERLVDLPRGGVAGAAVDLRHQEDLVAIAVEQRFAHALLARAAVVVPAVVEERDAAVDGGADDADALHLVALLPMW
jgi:hypothetical protein